eukprot:1037000-Pleurochrysis_carterae.AAC.1
MRPQAVESMHHGRYRGRDGDRLRVDASNRAQDGDEFKCITTACDKNACARKERDAAVMVHDFFCTVRIGERCSVEGLDGREHGVVCGGK